MSGEASLYRDLLFATEFLVYLRNSLIIAVSIGCGLAVTIRPELLSKLPAFVKEVFGSGITVGALVAVFLNLCLPGRQIEIFDDEACEDTGELVQEPA